MAISVKNVSFIYGEGTPFEKKALNNVSLDISDGEFVGLIGHTGSGKSTLIQHLNGLIKPTEGEITVNGISTLSKGSQLKELRCEVGLVFQYPEYQLFEETVFLDIAFGPKNLGLSDDEIKERVFSAMKSVGLSPELMDKSPFNLSGGQKRRVAIAGVLAMKPKVLILDEPAAGLDPSGRKEILSEIRKLYDEEKMTIILVSHSMEDIANVAERIVVMAEGEVKMDGNPSEIFSHSELLKSLGLDVPQVSSLVEELRKRGVNLPSDIYTVDEAKKQILSLIRREGEKNA